MRHALSWKTLYYGGLLPALARLGPARADAVLAGLGRLAGALPPRRGELARAIERTQAILGADWEATAARQSLAVGILRTLARDYLLEGASEADLTARFDVSGEDPVREIQATGRGAILLGCHLGAHLAGVHWLVRQGWPLRLLVQRPRHVSPTLHAWFDRESAGRLPQSDYFLRRDLDPAAAVRRVLLARDALRSGRSVYVNGDVPWPTASARPARFLGVERPFLTLWADLAARTGAPVVPVFCTHQPGGRYRLTFDAPFSLAPGDEPAALERYLRRLEAEVSAHPGDAVPYLTWPTYTRPASEPHQTPRHPGRPHASGPPAGSSATAKTTGRP